MFFFGTTKQSPVSQMGIASFRHPSTTLRMTNGTRNDFYLLINSESSRERIVAVATASISIERSPCDSNS